MCWHSIGGRSGSARFLSSWAVGKASGHKKFQVLAFKLSLCMTKWPRMLSKTEVTQIPREAFKIIREVLGTPHPIAVSLGSPQLRCPEPCCINASLIPNGSSDPGTFIWDVKRFSWTGPGFCKIDTPALHKQQSLPSQNQMQIRKFKDSLLRIKTVNFIINGLLHPGKFLVHLFLT